MLTSQRSANRFLSCTLLSLRAGNCQSKSSPSKSNRRRQMITHFVNLSIFSREDTSLENPSLPLSHPPTDKIILSRWLSLRRRMIRWYLQKIRGKCNEKVLTEDGLHVKKNYDIDFVLLFFLFALIVMKCMQLTKQKIICDVIQIVCFEMIWVFKTYACFVNFGKGEDDMGTEEGIDVFRLEPMLSVTC